MHERCAYPTRPKESPDAAAPSVDDAPSPTILHPQGLGTPWFAVWHVIARTPNCRDRSDLWLWIRRAFHDTLAMPRQLSERRSHAGHCSGIGNDVGSTKDGCEMTPDQASDDEIRAATAAAEQTMRLQRVPVNVYQAPEALVVIAPFPAVTPEDVMVELRHGVLRISARVRSAGPREYLVHEWEYGGYEREIDIPSEYGSAVEAALRNGQLVVRVLRGPPVAESLSVHPTSGSPNHTSC